MKKAKSKTVVIRKKQRTTAIMTLPKARKRTCFVSKSTWCFLGEVKMTIWGLAPQGVNLHA